VGGDRGAARQAQADDRRRDPRPQLAPGLKGKTPEQTVAAQLAVHAKRGLYVERPERGKFRLKRGGSATTKPDVADHT
jgi:hypothetical protein